MIRHFTNKSPSTGCVTTTILSCIDRSRSAELLNIKTQVKSDNVDSGAAVALFYIYINKTLSGVGAPREEVVRFLFLFFFFFNFGCRLIAN